MTNLDVIQLQNQIIAHPTKIADLLENMGFEHIKDNDTYYSFQNLNGDNPKAVVIYKSNLKYINFSHGSEGNIFTLVMETKHYSFPEALRYVANVLHLYVTQIHVKLPFGGFYRELISDMSDDNTDLAEYSESKLPDAQSLSWKFLKDGVSLQVQQKLGVRYSQDDDAVLIPIYDINHRLVGCKGRNNNPDVDMNHRWFMYLPYRKSNIVYGLDVNYSSIIKHQKGFIFEAEKSVMQGLSMEFELGMAIGGHNFSRQQVTLIQALNINELIVAFDQGLKEEEIIYEAKKLLVRTKCFSNRVFYIYDREGKYMPKDSKFSPTDQGKKIFMQLIKNCIYEVNENG